MWLMWSSRALNGISGHYGRNKISLWSPSPLCCLARFRINGLISWCHQSRGPLTHWGRVTHICVSKLSILISLPYAITSFTSFINIEAGQFTILFLKSNFIFVTKMSSTYIFNGPIEISNRCFRSWFGADRTKNIILRNQLWPGLRRLAWVIRISPSYDQFISNSTISRDAFTAW